MFFEVPAVPLARFLKLLFLYLTVFKKEHVAILVGALSLLISHVEFREEAPSLLKEPSRLLLVQGFVRARKYQSLTLALVLVFTLMRANLERE